MKHSPTPWILTETPTHVTVRSANNELIFHDDKRLPEVLADARLVAAAPDNYECNIELAAIVRELCAVYNHPLPQASLDRSDAAISKARGEK